MSEYVGKTNWQLYEIVGPDDMNRIEKRIIELGGEVENVSAPVTSVNLLSSAWTEKDFYFEQSVSTELFEPNVQPIITVDPDTLLQVITDQDCLLCINEQGRLKFRAYGVKKPESSLTIQIAQLFIKLKSGVPTPNFYSNMLGVNPVMDLPLPKQISNLQAEAQEGEQPVINLSWTNPEDENFSGVKIVVKQGFQPNSVDDGTEVYSGSDTSASYTALNWDVTYYFRAFAYNSQNAYNTNTDGAVAAAMPSLLPDQAKSVEFTGNKSKMSITWENPTNPSYKETKVIYKINSQPDSPNDGTTVYTGTGTSTEATGLQDGIIYYFAVYTIGKTGKYRDPVVQQYIPKIYPQYTYTGQHILVKDDADHWRIKFFTSGTLTWLGEDTEIDLFLVGGGGGGKLQSAASGASGGGGGYTKTVKKIRITKNQTIQIVIGAGGTAQTNGGSTSFGDNSVDGGQAGQYNKGGDGGSGGGGGTNTTPVGSEDSKAGDGGSDGKNGNAGISGSVKDPGGNGQGTTTREFGEPDGDLYSGGGGGMAYTGHSSYKAYGGNGGDGDGQISEPKTSTSSTASQSWGRGKGGGGYGGGGGGNWKSDSNSPLSAGAQGIVIIRDTREAA